MAMLRVLSGALTAAANNREVRLLAMLDLPAAFNCNAWTIQFCTTVAAEF